MECFLNINEIYIEHRRKRTKECCELKQNSGRVGKQQNVRIAKNINDIVAKLNSMNDIESMDNIGELVELLIQLNETFDPNLGLTEIYISQLKNNIDCLIYRLCALLEQVLQYSNQIQILPGCPHHYIQSAINLVIQ